MNPHDRLAGLAGRPAHLRRLLRRGAGLRAGRALYRADSAYHSGKYFVFSDTGDWNEAGRPRLEVWWQDNRR